MTNYRRRKKPNSKIPDKEYLINREIKHPQIRLVSDDEGLIGLMSSKEAIALAEERELDLIEINPKAVPPVVKLVDYNKWRYAQTKAEVKKSQKVDKLKTIRLSVKIAPHDLNVQVTKCQEFLDKGFTVKVQVYMRGREKAHPEVAEEVIYNFLNSIEVPFSYVTEPKLMGSNHYTTIKPGKK